MGSKHNGRLTILAVAATLLSGAAFYFGAGLDPHRWLTWVAALPLLLAAPYLPWGSSPPVAFAANALGALSFWSYLRQQLHFMWPCSVRSPGTREKAVRKNAVGTLNCVLATVICVLAMAGSAFAQNPDWTAPFPPFRVAGNLYYVGSQGLANYLITTPKGNILINCDRAANVEMIQASIEKLGFKFTDTKILLISHAHWDHDAGCAAIKEMTGAAYMVMDADVPVVESGGRADFQYGHSADNLYRPAKVDRVLHDGDEVKLGGAVLVAHLTPGHTKGCTTWTMNVREGNKTCDVVIVGSPNVNPGYRLVNNAAYPRIAEDYERTFRVLKSLPCDIFLGAHGSYFTLGAKYAAMEQGHGNPFIDPEGYKKYVQETEKAFHDELTKQGLAAN